MFSYQEYIIRRRQLETGTTTTVPVVLHVVLHTIRLCIYVTLLPNIVQRLPHVSRLITYLPRHYWLQFISTRCGNQLET